MKQWPTLILITLCNTVAITLLNEVIVSFIHQHDVFGRWSAIVSTLSGFLVATYQPLGLMPDIMQKLIKLFPSAYAAAAYRQIWMKDLINDNVPSQGRSELIKQLGIGLRIHGSRLTVNQEMIAMLCGGGICLVLLVLVSGLHTEEY
ncbi:MAG: hypothetical protein Q3978_07065 [Limosilactobacillus gorillae]|jgi:multidrug/hemolysin transport system permease protein|nr:hypothetical protein [Limosilactobacillus gorillae]